ncbi:YihY/virulence factor BrkB family protein [Chelativorans sp. YIM 93263]|uniref:YihY/virulence factor BrkB family protein n=1 Tax=Chelativorans sp. YIM 93263 TaxID=2906648 RepID=UPI002378B402|nr:YihY/virulence factor BrkB family protein [Chelativorans sp. YIM 93263]
MGKQQMENSPAGRGREAEWPAQIPGLGWKDILWRVFREIGSDRIMLVAAGVTFYLMLAIFPALVAFVSLYGLVADPTTIAQHISLLSGLLPEAGLELLRDQLNRLAEGDGNALSFGFLSGLLFSLWSANAGVKALFDALNVAYEEQEKRGFIALTLLSFGFTLGAMLIAAVLIFSIGLAPAMLALLDFEQHAETLIRLTRWPITFAIVAIATSVVYRYGPSRERAKWRWISWGAALTTLVWFGASFAFSLYLQNFASYDATYGSLGTIIAFMMWIWISAMILLIGAEINAEMEHQTGRDSTVGEEKPIGHRGAVVADTLGESADREEDR